MALFTFRFLQLGWRVITGEVDKIIASHEVEEEIEEALAYEEELSDSKDESDNNNGGKS
jgi:C4-dicarboxylate transporter DctQ subunit